MMYCKQNSSTGAVFGAFCAQKARQCWGLPFLYGKAHQ